MIGYEKVMDSCAGQAFREDGDGSVSPALVIDVIHVSTPLPMTLIAACLVEVSGGAHIFGRPAGFG